MPKPKPKRPTVTFTLIDPADVTKIQNEIDALRAEAETLKIETVEQSVAATKVLARAQKLRRETDKAFKAVKAPIVAKKREIDTEHNTLVDACAAVEDSIERMILAFRKAEDDRRATAAAAEMRQREEAARVEQEKRAAELREAAASAKTKSVAKLLEKQAEIIENATPYIDPVDSGKPTMNVLGEGAHTRKKHRAVVSDFEKLVLQVAAQLMIAKYGAPPAIAGWLTQFNPNAQASVGLLIPKMPPLNELANRLNTDLALEGVIAEADESIITR